MAKLLNAYLDYTSNDKPIKDRKIFVFTIYFTDFKHIDTSSKY